MKIRLIILLSFFLNTFVYGDLLKENFITFDLNASVPKAVVDFESDNLEKFMKLDDNDNGIVSWKEIKAHRDDIEKFVLTHLQIAVDGKKCESSVEKFQVYRRIHQSYIKLFLALSCELPKEAISLKYDLFFDVDKDQKAFVKISDKSGQVPAILSSRKMEVNLKLQKESVWSSFANFFVEGVWHIWIGFDHILFLLMLLIPSVYIYKEGRFYPREKFKDVLFEILKVVTAFSVAHSLTLALSVTKTVTLNSAFVEVAIAVSVLFTAVNNLHTIVKHKVWIMAFGFGLIHGFGFANVLHELLVKNSDFVAMLLGFNLGVETGQLVIVITLLPLLYFFRRGAYYRYFILYGFSAVTAVIAFLWALERAFGLSLLPF